MDRSAETDGDDPKRSRLKIKGATVLLAIMLIPVRGLSGPGDSSSAWAHALVAKIQRNWTRPSDAPKYFSCVVELQIHPDGQAINRAIAQSCGTSNLDDS